MDKREMEEAPTQKVKAIPTPLLKVHIEEKTIQVTPVEI